VKLFFIILLTVNYKMMLEGLLPFEPKQRQIVFRAICRGIQADAMLFQN
jgi:hypothetical protein